MKRRAEFCLCVSGWRRQSDIKDDNEQRQERREDASNKYSSTVRRHLAKDGPDYAQMRELRKYI